MELSHGHDLIHACARFPRRAAWGVAAGAGAGGRVPQPPGPLQPEGRVDGVQQRDAAAPLQPPPAGGVLPQQPGAAPGEGEAPPDLVPAALLLPSAGAGSAGPRGLRPAAHQQPQDPAPGAAHAGPGQRHEGARAGAAGRDAGPVCPGGQQQGPGGHLQLPALLREPAGAFLGLALLSSPVLPPVRAVVAAGDLCWGQSWPLLQPPHCAVSAEWLPRKAENLTPYTMALIAKYVARHRLREPRLLDTIANFLLKRGEQLDSKVIQKLVFPFSRMNYRPSNHGELFPKLEAILEQKAGSSPLATVNILMSMFQLSHFPQTVLHQVFSPGFITNVMSTPYALIVRRYLSLLDAAVELEFREYSGPRLDPRYRVLMFEHALTADEANRKYSYKGLVAEALRQLVGEECYRQDEVLPPGYCTGNPRAVGRRGLPGGI
uniref:Fas activated serine/threonine kinase n=1 Tax=Zosterops lateralis melanops TaxID=1220523 RepID=A0A8D2P694_ZOSLA